MPDGAERIFNYIGNPGVVDLDPRWHQAVLRFVVMGFEHILEGTDHLLFLFCLVIPLRSLRGLIPVVTSFTIAHSITLISSAFGLAPNVLWFPPLIETLIALSIVYMAFENIVGARLEHRWDCSQEDGALCVPSSGGGVRRRERQGGRHGRTASCTRQQRKVREGAHHEEGP